SRCTASTAAKTGSGISTMPGPPPNGRSSTLLCLPVAQSRIFQRWISTKPLSMASLRMLWLKYPWKISGNRVRTSKRMLRCRRCLCLRGCRLLLELCHVFLQEHRDAFRRLSPNAEPVFDPVGLERHPLVSVLDHRVIGAQFFDDAAVARLPRVDGHNPKIRAVLPPESFHANANCHKTYLSL